MICKDKCNACILNTSIHYLFPSSWKIDCSSLYHTLLFSVGSFGSQWQLLLYMYLMTQWVHLDVYPMQPILFRGNIVYVYCKINIFHVGFFSSWIFVWISARILTMCMWCSKIPDHNDSQQCCLCVLSGGFLYFLANIELKGTAALFSSQLSVLDFGFSAILWYR